MKSIHLLPKTIKNSTVHLEWKCCGRENCRCAKGQYQHGPYFARRWREKGRQFKHYIPAAQVLQALSNIEEEQNDRENLSEVRSILRELGKSIGKR